MSLMVSISGLRGIVGQSLTPDVVVRYASAFAEYCNRGPIVIGRDGRMSGKGIGHVVSSTLLSMGSDVIAIGICPTPTIQLAVEQAGAAGGISVTASHNPIQWNGLKFLASTGLFLDGEENRRFWSLADRPGRSYAMGDKQGTHRAAAEYVDHHIDEILRLCYVDVASLHRRKLKVVLDCVNGSGGVLIPKLLKELGCTVTEMNCDASGAFAHLPEPIPENLTDLCKRVAAEKADLGIAVDPDADRLVLIDERGEPYGEEYTIASVVKFVLEKESKRASQSATRQSDPPTVVVNLSTTRAVDDIARSLGAKVVRTPVGEINVAKKMKEIGALVGGEGSGGVILPKVHLGRDAPVGIGLILQQFTEHDGTVSHFKRTLPQYQISKGKVELGSLNPNQVLSQLATRYATNGHINRLDGLKIDFADSWVHLRKSNTEPIIRIIAEAPDKQQADALVQQFTAAVGRRD